MSDTPTPSFTNIADSFILKPPVSFRVAQGLVMLGLAALIAWSLSCLPSGGCAAPRYYWALFCAMALIGLVRRVAWGQFLVFVVDILVCLNVLATAIPWPDDPEEERGLTPLLGTLPPAWVSITLVVIVCTLLLTPLVVIGWRKNYFRGAWW